MISCADKARLIARLRQQHNLADPLQAAGLARSTFYYQCEAAQRANPQRALWSYKIRAVYDEHKGRYGYRRITAALCNSMGQPVNLERDFCAAAPNKKCVTDVTEFNVNGHKLYLSACMDLYNGEIIAHQMARRPVFELVASTLRAALSRTACTAQLIVHSDQGWHYKMQPYRAALAQRGVKQSMSRKGNCFDNAAMESFLGTLKAEYFHLAAPSSLDALEAGVHDYVHCYNHERIKLRLNGISPVQYRMRNTA